MENAQANGEPLPGHVDLTGVEIVNFRTTGTKRDGSEQAVSMILIACGDRLAAYYDYRNQCFGIADRKKNVVAQGHTHFMALEHAIPFMQDVIKAELVEAWLDMSDDTTVGERRRVKLSIAELVAKHHGHSASMDPYVAAYFLDLGELFGDGRGRNSMFGPGGVIDAILRHGR